MVGFGIEAVDRTLVDATVAMTSGERPEIQQQGPAAEALLGGMEMPVQSSAAMDRAIQKIHQPIHHVAGPMPTGMIVADRILVRSVAKLVDRFAGRGRKRTLLAPRFEALDLSSEPVSGSRPKGFPDPLV